MCRQAHECSIEVCDNYHIACFTSRGQETAEYMPCVSMLRNCEYVSMPTSHMVVKFRANGTFYQL